MGCCGQQRGVLVNANATGASASPESGASVDLRFTQRSAVLVRGPVTGRHYQFNGTAHAQRVDARDAASLVKSGYFEFA